MQVFGPVVPAPGQKTVAPAKGGVAMNADRPGRSSERSVRPASPEENPAISPCAEAAPAAFHRGRWQRCSGQQDFTYQREVLGFSRPPEVKTSHSDHHQQL